MCFTSLHRCKIMRLIIGYIGGVRGVMVIDVGNGHGDTCSILDETDCILHRTNTFRKCMNPIILPPAMGK